MRVLELLSATCAKVRLGKISAQVPNLAKEKETMDYKNVKKELRASVEKIDRRKDKIVVV